MKLLQILPLDPANAVVSEILGSTSKKDFINSIG